LENSLKCMRFIRAVISEGDFLLDYLRHKLSAVADLTAGLKTLEKYALILRTAGSMSRFRRRRFWLRSENARVF